MSLPIIHEYKGMNNNEKRLLIAAEGFEDRAIHWIDGLNQDVLFCNAILCQYVPVRKSKLKIIKAAIEKRTENKPLIMKFNRFSPDGFERAFSEFCTKMIEYTDVYIDITVMSKFLIMILVFGLHSFEGRIHFIYSEPETWGPSKERFHRALSSRKKGNAVCLSSKGVGEIVRTSSLSSIIMQNEPSILIAGLSFNEMLVNLLINELNPEKLFLINQGCNRIPWREDAIELIHREIIESYGGQDRVIYKYELFEYDKVFDMLAEKYKQFWLTHRMIVSPTGYKTHAIAFGLFKLCCPDIHVEYPTPDSYSFKGYSEGEVVKTYEICIDNMSNTIARLTDEYDLQSL